MKNHAAIAAVLAASIVAGDAAAKPATCPAINVLADAVRITQLQNGRIDLKAEIRKPALDCTVAAGKASSKVSFWVKSVIAPTSDIGPRNVPYFVAIIVDGEIIGKEIFDLELAFGNDRKLMVKEKVARVDIPVAAGKTAEDYSVTIGFQLTPEQAEYNRTAQR
jgi:hypothetical protein